jgi:hypothetical protein
MNLRSIFVLVFMFVLFCAPIVYADTDIYLKCVKTGTSTASIPPFGWMSIKSRDCNLDLSISYETIPDVEGRCSCEGTYSIKANSSCENDKGNGTDPVDALQPDASGWIAYIVNYDDPPSGTSLYSDPPYYCRGDCVRKPKPGGGTIDADVYWDGNYNIGGGITGECCGDDYDLDSAPEYRNPLSADDPDNSPGFCRGDGTTGGCPLGNKYDDPTHREWADTAPSGNKC